MVLVDLVFLLKQATPSLASIGSKNNMDELRVDIYCEQYPGPSKRAKKTVQVETNKVLLKVTTTVLLSKSVNE